MAILLLDTNIVSFMMKRHPFGAAYRSDIESGTPAISPMTVAELFEGAFKSNWSAKRLAELRTTIRSYVLLRDTMRVCEVWGRIRADRRSQPISVDDAWIAGTAINYNCPLVTHNPGDFQGIKGLTIITHHE